MKGNLAFTSTPSPCQYLPDRIWQLRYEVHPEITPADYTLRLQSGWRRFGPVLFRPECPACRMCQSLRVPVESFRPNESQRRTWRQNAGEVEIRIGPPSITPEKIALSARFHDYGRQVKGWPEDGEPDLRFFTRNPFRTEEWTYHLGGRLIGVGYVDALAEGLSAIYFYWDPADAKRSLGTFNVLAMIAAAKERGVPHVYLGYYVEGCRSLEYKARFTPNEVLRESGTWAPFLP
jgi:arginyl-tRNA--protein-N-Asp/Glu arginylyltransferase